MAIVAVVIVCVLAFGIAAVVIGRETQRLGSQRLQPVYRLPEAAGFVAERLGADDAATLSEADVTEVVRIHLNLLQFESGATDDESEEDAVVDEDDAEQVVYRRARQGGVEVTRPQVASIMAAHVGYLQAIGAISAGEDQE